MTRIEIRIPKPHIGQLLVLNNIKRFNVLACGRRWGKSILAENLLIKKALDGKPVGYFTPTYKLLELTYDSLYNRLYPIISKKHENQKIQLINGGVIDFWSMDNQLAGRSRKYARVVLDEVGFQRGLKERWDEAIRPTLTDFKGDGFMMSSPKGRNDFYKYYLKSKDNESWASFQLPTANNPHIDKNEIEEAKKELPEMAFRQEYLAEFLENQANPFGYDSISANVAEMSNEPPMYIGIDLAKSYDYTVIIGLDAKGYVCLFNRFQHDWANTIAIINQLPNVATCIDSTGVGDAVAEIVSRNKLIEMFKFTQISKQELMAGLSVSIQQGKIKYPKGDITTELESFEYVFSSSGVRYSAPAGLHDDCVCALALANRLFINKNQNQARIYA